MKYFAQSVRQKGSVVIVALCFVAVLGIALASYLAVSNQAMKLSNRTYLKSVSRHLAEMGLEQALWAFNRNRWDDAVWGNKTTVGQVTFATLDPTIQIPSSLYGNGVSGTVEVQVQNYDSIAKGTPWSSIKSYRSDQNDVVTFDGVSKWNNTINYNVNTIVRYDVNGLTYRCILANLGQPPTNATYWGTPIPAVTDFRAWYIAAQNPTTKSPPDAINWTPATPRIYAEGIATAPSGEIIRTQLSGTVTLTPLFPQAIAAATDLLELGAGGVVDSYNSSPNVDAALTPATDYSPPASPIPPSYFSATLGSGNQVKFDAPASIYGYVASPSFSAALGSTLIGSSGGSGIDYTRVTRSPYIPQFAPSIWYQSTGFVTDDVVRDQNSPGTLYRYNSTSLSSNSNDLSDTSYWTPAVQVLAPTSAPQSVPIPAASGLQVCYIDADVTLIAGQEIRIDVPCVLDIHGNLTINGGKITVGPNGSAEIHVQGQVDVKNILGSGIDNLTKDPKKLLLVRDLLNPPSPTNNFSPTIPFYGVLYLPQCKLSVGSGQIYGAVSADKVTFFGNANLHYDTSLRLMRYHSIDMLYVVNEWRELTDPADQVAFP